ncbi:small-ligand-binding protein [Streptomyces zinciresistens K42]|uniref:Small-ligand-binding protein n=1 Tax=Streptomyces zinciresistens K42 TaxID=700597 RepID=G2GG57_9ACTN|nr:TOBE domain-containing protein [Streptomyces zinciresistens]EGX57527.1 small-ligand-binding protein [Streptomyces zinciresistens K42]
MSLSIRNQIPGTVVSLTRGEAMATVRVRLSGGGDITAAVTLDAVDELGLDQGTAVHALVKATEVALATGPVEGLSLRNRLPGTVRQVRAGAAMASVRVAVDGGELTAAVTRDAVTELGLAEGSDVTVLFKSTEVSLSTG